MGHGFQLPPLDELMNWRMAFLFSHRYVPVKLLQSYRFVFFLNQLIPLTWLFLSSLPLENAEIGSTGPQIVSFPSTRR